MKTPIPLATSTKPSGGDEPVGPDEVRLAPGIPGMLDMDGVVMGTPMPGLYQLYSGEEIYALSALLSFDSGDRLRVGVGSKVVQAAGPWMVTGFSPDQTMLLQRAGTVALAALEIPRDDPMVFPDAEVSNLWIQKDQPVATWVADLTPAVREDPSRISVFVDTVLAAGEATGMLHVHEVSAQGFREAEDGSFADWVRSRRPREMVPDLFGEMGGLSASAELAFFNKAGRLVESPVRRLDRVLGREEPHEGAFDGFMQNHPPIVLQGTSSETMSAVLAGDWDRRIELRVVLHSDIWFPWINGVNHPLCDYKHSFDNRLLADLHTPRLNTFLAAVADAAEAAGGSFVLDCDETNVRPESVTDRGIVLDGPGPAAQFTEDERNASWD